MSPVFASSRLGNFVRAVLTIAVITLVYREIYLLWFFHTPEWNSRPNEIKWCGEWYERTDQPDMTQARARQVARGPLRTVTRSPVLRPVVAHKPGDQCPDWVFAKVGEDRYVGYLLKED